MREVTQQMSKCQELCQILAEDMQQEGIKVEIFVSLWTLLTGSLYFVLAWLETHHTNH